MRGEDPFEPALNIYTALLAPPPTVTPNFLFAPNKMSSRNKLFLGIKNIGGAFAPPPSLRLRLVHFRQAQLIAGREF
jgi:hypothetical protein